MLARGGEVRLRRIWDATGGIGMVGARGCCQGERLVMYLRAVERRRCQVMGSFGPLGHDSEEHAWGSCDATGGTPHGDGRCHYSGVVPVEWEGARWSCGHRMDG